MRSCVPSTRRTARFDVCCCLAEAFLPQPVAARDTPPSAGSHAVRPSMPSRSAKDVRKWKTGQFLVIGKAIC